MNNCCYYQSNKDLAIMRIEEISQKFTKETRRNKEIKLQISEVEIIEKKLFGLIKFKKCIGNDKAIVVSEFSGTIMDYAWSSEVEGGRYFIYDKAKFFDKIEEYYNDMLKIAKDFKVVVEESSNLNVSMFEIRKMLNIHGQISWIDQYKEHSNYEFKSFYELMK